MKKLLTTVILVLFVTTALFTLAACESKGELWLENVKIEAALDTNGNLRVSEKWEAGFASSEGYRNLYKTMDLYDTDFNAASQITDITVYDNDSGDQLARANISGINDYQITNNPNKYYAISTGSNKYEIGVIFPKTKTGTRSYTFSYTLTNAVGAYADTSVLNWKQFSEDFELYISNYESKITLPNNASTEGTRGWFHTEGENSNLEIAQNSLVYNASAIKTGTWVETRIAMPNTLFVGLQKQKSESKLQSIIDEEAKWANDWAAEKQRQYVLSIVGVVFAVILLAAAIGLVVFLNLKNKRKKGNFPKYFRDIPQEWTAGELGHLFYYYEGGVEKKNLRGRLLSATILELARRNYIEIIPSADDDYKIHVNAVPTVMAADLKPYENTLLRLLARVESSTMREFTMDDFERYAKKNYNDIDNSINEFNTKSKDWFRRGNFVGKMSSFMRNLNFVGIGMAVLGGLMFTMGSGSFFTISLVISGIILFLGVPKLPSLNDKGEAEYFRAVALKQYMLDFSNLKEYDIPQLIIWEEYLVYATMMNISKEVIQNLKLVYPEISKETDQGGMGYNRPMGSYLFTYLWLSRMSRSGMPAFDLGSRIERSMTNIRNTAHTLKHPPNRGGGIGGGGFGGGGFRGGGGGFGGGGGGGRR